ncbi:MAG: SprT family zinc-dependent metalloprotease [Ignavibacteriales bacterium]|nr:SprT family zinc-dependent metalloprotease [Ignavibacteriales bacterium]
MTKRSIEFGSKKIEYLLFFNHRKTLGITVTPELQVLVKAPAGAPAVRVDQIVRRRAPWILKQRDYFLAFYPKQPPKRYLSGETHLYLGKQYRLKVKKGKTELVRLIGKYFTVVSHKPSDVKSLMKEWYWFHAECRFEEILEVWLPRFRTMHVQPTELQLREMPKRWGSCTTKGKIILNPELIKAPRRCIEYVIVHELCHLVHRNHNRDFVDLQARILPDWELWKDRLERFLA